MLGHSKSYLNLWEFEFLHKDLLLLLQALKGLRCLLIITTGTEMHTSHTFLLFLFYFIKQTEIIRATFPELNIARHEKFRVLPFNYETFPPNLLLHIHVLNVSKESLQNFSSKFSLTQ